MEHINKTVIFDLDGTLVDTLPDIFEALKSTAKQFDLELIPEKTLRKLLSRGSRTLIRTQFEYSKKNFSEKDIELGVDHFINFYQSNISTYSKLFPGILDCLNWLKNESANIAICTNKYEKLAKQLIKDLGISNYFNSITGSDTFKYRKPNPYHLVNTIKLANGSLKNSVLIGDSTTDLKTGRNANIPIIIVGWGYSDIPPHQIGGDDFINNGSQLISSIKKILY